MDADRELPCLRCRYDLRTLDARGVCPECGAPIGPSLAAATAAAADPLHLARPSLHRGAALILAAVALRIAVMLLTAVRSLRVGATGSVADALCEAVINAFDAWPAREAALVAILVWRDLEPLWLASNLALIISFATQCAGLWLITRRAAAAVDVATPPEPASPGDGVLPRALPRVMPRLLPHLLPHLLPRLLPRLLRPIARWSAAVAVCAWVGAGLLALARPGFWMFTLHPAAHALTILPAVAMVLWTAHLDGRLIGGADDERFLRWATVGAAVAAQLLPLTRLPREMHAFVTFVGFTGLTWMWLDLWRLTRPKR